MAAQPSSIVSDLDQMLSDLRDTADAYTDLVRADARAAGSAMVVVAVAGAVAFAALLVTLLLLGLAGAALLVALFEWPWAAGYAVAAAVTLLIVGACAWLIARAARDLWFTAARESLVGLLRGFRDTSVAAATPDS